MGGDTRPARWARTSGRAVGRALAIGALLALASSCAGPATPVPPTGAGESAGQVASQPVRGPTTYPAPSAASTPGPGDIALPSDPCSILMTAEVQAATGIAFPAGSRQSAGAAVECDYASGPATVFLVVRPLDAQAFASGRSVSTPLIGLGDDAYQRAVPSQLHVAMANIEIVAQAGLGGTAAADQAAELALAKLVLAKLAT